MITVNENTTRKDTLHNVWDVKFNVHSTNYAEIAWEAVWFFFVGGDDDFTRLYERRIVDTHEQEDAIYVLCSQYLFDQEYYVANLLDEGDTKELALRVLLPLGEKIKEILN
jgi:hypothetical protein